MLSSANRLRASGRKRYFGGISFFSFLFSSPPLALGRPQYDDKLFPPVVVPPLVSSSSPPSDRCLMSSFPFTEYVLDTTQNYPPQRPFSHIEPLRQIPSQLCPYPLTRSSSTRRKTIPSGSRSVARSSSLSQSRRVRPRYDDKPSHPTAALLSVPTPLPDDSALDAILQLLLLSTLISHLPPHPTDPA